MKEPRQPKEKRAIDEFEEWGERTFLEEGGCVCPELVRRGVAIFSQNPDWCRRLMAGPELYPLLYSRMQKRISQMRRVFVIAPPPAVTERVALPDGITSTPVLPSGNGAKPTSNASEGPLPLGSLTGLAGRWDLCTYGERIDGKYVLLRHMTGDMLIDAGKERVKKGLGELKRGKRLIRLGQLIKNTVGDKATVEDVFPTPEEVQVILEGTDGNSAAQTESLQGEFPEFTSPEEVQ